tara:strand:+ start:8581 stop:8805 length:225 start_codon:yes stop_codon:yes gene_type:complete
MKIPLGKPPQPKKQTELAGVRKHLGYSVEEAAHIVGVLSFVYRTLEKGGIKSANAPLNATIRLLAHNERTNNNK